MVSEVLCENAMEFSPLIFTCRFAKREAPLLDPPNAVLPFDLRNALDRVWKIEVDHGGEFGVIVQAVPKKPEQRGGVNFGKRGFSNSHTPLGTVVVREKFEKREEFF